MRFIEKVVGGRTSVVTLEGFRSTFSRKREVAYKKEKKGNNAESDEKESK